MDKPPLGRLKPVDLRTYWLREDTEFTPWLAQDDKLELLSETLGLNLVVEDQEVQVGPFRADILARDLVHDVPVLIENQLERTNHLHLGQLLTYAAGLDAVNIVWIASQFTEEHRAALDWLNSVTSEEIHFFGLEIELWRIGDSAPAPKFNLVSKPNEWSKRVSSARRPSKGSSYVDPDSYLTFWIGFADYVRQEGSPFQPPNPSGRNWIEVGPPFPGIRVTISYSERSKQCRIYVLVRKEGDPKRFEFLEGRAESISVAVGQDLEWHPQPDRGGGWFGWAGPVVENGGVEAHYEWLAERLTGLFPILQDLVGEFDSSV